MSNKILPIKVYGEEILRKKADDVENIDGKLVETLDSLLITMKLGKGLGLAANQVGIDQRFFSIDLSYFDVVKEPLVIINPKIAEVSENIANGEEGCLSFPGLFFEVERPEKATISGLDRDGNEIIVEGKGLMARVLLHELDHLNGKLFIDYLSKFRKSMMKGKLKKIKAGESV